MTAVVLLLGSVLLQGVGIVSTRASAGLRRWRWVLAAFATMALSVGLMAHALALGLPLAVGYGIWSGSGIVLGAAGAAAFFGERLARDQVLALALVLVGVVLVYAAA